MATNDPQHTDLGSETYNPNDVMFDPPTAVKPAEAPVKVGPTPAPKAAPKAPAVKAAAPKAPEPKVAAPKTPETPTATPAPVTGASCACGKPKGDEHQEAAPVAKKATSDTYAKRRTIAARVIVTAIVIAGVALWLQPWKTAAGLTAGEPASADTVTVASTEQATTDQVSADVEFAEEYLTKNGTLAGIRLEGAQIAVSNKTLYAVRVIDGTCTVYGLLDGQRLTPATDPSGAACAGQIVTVQAQLDQAASQVQSNAQNAAEDTLREAAATAVQFASRNFVNGAPSMTGLPATLAGATIQENSGDYVMLRVSYPGACIQAYVTAAGETGNINTCS